MLRHPSLRYYTLSPRQSLPGYDSFVAVAVHNEHVGLSEIETEKQLRNSRNIIPRSTARAKMRDLREEKIEPFFRNVRTKHSRRIRYGLVFLFSHSFSSNPADHV